MLFSSTSERDYWCNALAEFQARHRVSSPSSSGWVTCSCGAVWYVFRCRDDRVVVAFNRSADRHTSMLHSLRLLSR